MSSNLPPWFNSSKRIVEHEFLASIHILCFDIEFLNNSFDYLYPDSNNLPLWIDT